MNLNKITKKELINILADCFGYGLDDWDYAGEPMSKNQILDYLTKKQKETLKEF